MERAAPALTMLTRGLGSNLQAGSLTARGVPRTAAGPRLKGRIRNAKTRSWRRHCIVVAAPAWYINRQDQQIEVGDELEIIGCPIQMQGAAMMMARQVTSDGMTLTLRDEEGHPYWSCWRSTGARQRAAPG